jgi:hypothetical protein
MDPFSLYARMFSVGLDMTRTAHRTAEMFGASREVIEERTGMMKTAFLTPLKADHAELQRMVPEKAAAFAEAGRAMAGDWWALQLTLFAQAQQLGVMALRGRPPTAAELLALSSRNATFAVRMIEHLSAAGAKGLRPVHARATSNARRLKRARPRRP